jgi:hypothetical protein
MIISNQKVLLEEMIKKKCYSYHTTEKVVLFVPLSFAINGFNTFEEFQQLDFAHVSGWFSFDLRTNEFQQFPTWDEAFHGELLNGQKGVDA